MELNIKKDIFNAEHRWKLREWIDKDRLCWDILLHNPNAMYLFECNPDKIDWSRLEMNQNALYLLERNKEKINWMRIQSWQWAYHLVLKNTDHIRYDLLSLNPLSISFFEKNPDKINWKYMSMNPAGIDLLRKNKDKIDYTYLCINSNPEAYDWVYENLKGIEYDKDGNPYQGECKISWYSIVYSMNPRSIDILKEYIGKEPKLNKLWSGICEKVSKDLIPIYEKNMDKLDWGKLSSNPFVMDMIMQNLDKVSWHHFCLNPKCFSYLKENPDKIKWNFMCGNRCMEAIPWIEKHMKEDPQKIPYLELSGNPNIFELDFDFLKERMDLIREELLEKAWNPKRAMDWCISVSE